MGAHDYLVISDTQIPFEAEHALQFFVRLKRHYQIPDENVLHVGDEVDNLHGGLYPKDPDGEHSPTGELRAAREKIREWASAFPKMKLAISNHGQRWARKATAAEIPSVFLRQYQEVLGMPDTWQFKERWDFTTKHPFSMIHGMGYSGPYAHRTAAIDLGTSIIMGHLTHSGIQHIKTATRNIWGMCVGCCIDVDAVAFKYGKNSRFRPSLGGGVVADSGRIPMWIPYEP